MTNDTNGVHRIGNGWEPPKTPEQVEQEKHARLLAEWEKTASPEEKEDFAAFERCQLHVERLHQAAASLYIALDGVVPEKGSNRDPKHVFYAYNERGVRLPDGHALKSLKQRGVTLVRAIESLLKAAHPEDRASVEEIVP